MSVWGRSCTIWEKPCCWIFKIGIRIHADWTAYTCHSIKGSLRNKWIKIKSIIERIFILHFASGVLIQILLNAQLCLLGLIVLQGGPNVKSACHGSDYYFPDAGTHEKMCDEVQTVQMFNAQLLELFCHALWYHLWECWGADGGVVFEVVVYLFCQLQQFYHVAVQAVVEELYFDLFVGVVGDELALLEKFHMGFLTLAHFYLLAGFEDESGHRYRLMAVGLAIMYFCWLL